MKISDYIVKFFENKGIEYIFGYQGGMITHLVDSISKSKKISFIQTYHEQTAAIAAEGYARTTKKIGVAISTSGPGVTNMITGIANAYYDSIPVIYITGQVNTVDLKYNKKIRQQGFQELNVVELTKSITKYSVLIDKKEALAVELEKAYKIATSGRKGPVVLDIPMNIQREFIDEVDVEKYLENIEKNEGNYTLTREIHGIICEAKKPILLLGAGVFSENVENIIESFVKKTNIPVVTSLMGKGAVSDEKEYYMGMIGSYGNRCANLALSESDCVIAVGARLTNRQVGNLKEEFVKNKKIIHVDIDEEELKNNRLKNRMIVNTSAKKFFIELDKIASEIKISEKWLEYLKKIKNKFSQQRDIDLFIENKLPYDFLNALNNYTKRNDIITVDIGQNQMWSAQTIRLKEGQKWLTSGGLAPMGYSLAAAVGAAFGDKKVNVFSIMGDGGFQIALQALLLVSQYELPVKIIVLNNKSLGLITQFQEAYFNGNMIGTTEKGGYKVSKLEKIAEAFGIEYVKITKDNVQDTQLLNDIFSKNSIFIEVEINGLTKVFPKLEYDAKIQDMSPKLSKGEYEIYK